MIRVINVMQWLLILIFSGFYLTAQLSQQGRIDLPTFEKTFHHLSGGYQDYKFKMRGIRSSLQKIVIIGIDEKSIRTLGRWPWSRDKIASLIFRLREDGAQVVGLDFILAESEQLVPEKLENLLRLKGLASNLKEYETDAYLGEVLFRSRKNVVLGWAFDQFCRAEENDCGEDFQELSSDFKKYAFQTENPTHSKLKKFSSVIPNHSSFNIVTSFQGYLNSFEDPDGTIRRFHPVLAMNQQIYPSFAVSMAEAITKTKTDLTFEEDGTLRSLVVGERKLPINRRGELSINFGGPSFSFPYVSAVDVISDEEKVSVETKNEVLAVSRKEILKDALVIIGPTAQGLRDLRAFPFEANTRGVEGHAWALENLLSDNFLKVETMPIVISIWFLILLLGISIGYVSRRFTAYHGIGFLLGTVLVLSVTDQYVFFGNGYNFNFFFTYITILSVGALGLAGRLIKEERQKRKIRSIFGHYVSPNVVASILKEESPLSLSGRKKDLSIFFSDIRGFTTISERLDPQSLAEMLNQYMTLMTQILVDRYQGTLDKYIGDAIMAFWGAPLDQPDQHLKACLASIEMQRVLGEHRKDFKRDFKVDLYSGIGIHAGEVIVGNMGSSKNINYTVIGDSVNLASRLEGLTKTYACDIIVSKPVHDGMRKQNQSVQSRFIDRVRVVGKKDQVEVFEIFSQAVPEDGIKFFETGLHYYFDRNWKEAISFFEKANAEFKSALIYDKPTQIFHSRSLDNLENEPPADWDFSYDMRSK